MTMIDPVEALTLARETATLLENTAVDSTHTPSIYAHFLRSLIDSKVAGTRAGTRAGSRAGSPADVDAPRLLPDLTASLQDILDANAADDAAMAVNATSDGLYDAGFWANVIISTRGQSGGADTVCLADAHAFVPSSSSLWTCTYEFCFCCDCSRIWWSSWRPFGRRRHAVGRTAIRRLGRAWHVLDAGAASAVLRLPLFS